jgi:hypothetical protein
LLAEIDCRCRAAKANLSAYRKNGFGLILEGVPSGTEIVPRRAFKVKWEKANLGLLEVDCFVGVAIADNYGVLCLVTANGDLAVLHGCETHSGGEGVRRFLADLWGLWESRVPKSSAETQGTLIPASSDLRHPPCGTAATLI